MTPEELAELKRLEAAATPGPWRKEDAAPGVREETQGFVILGGKIFMTAADEAFIFAARNALPKLLARIEELENQLAARARGE